MRRISSLFKVILVFIVGLMFFNIINVKGESSTTDLIASLEKVAIRNEGVQGLKFDAQVLNKELIKEKGFYVVYGSTTILELEEAITLAGSNPLLLNGKEVFRVVVPGVREDGTFSVVLTGIPELGYLDNITVIPYAIKKETTKESFAVPVKRSVTEVGVLMDKEGFNLPLNVETYLNSLKKSRLTEEYLEVSNGLKDNLGQYVNFDLYNIYPPNIEELILPNPADKPGYIFNGYQLNETIYSPGDSFVFPEEDVVLTLKWEEIVTIEEHIETFDNMTLVGSSYVSGSHIGVNNQEWSYTDSRGDQPLDGKALILRAGSITTTFTNGLSKLGFDYVRAYTNSNLRSFEIYINGTLIETITVDPLSDTRKTYLKDNLNYSGTVELEIKGLGNQKFVDNIVWANYENLSDAQKLALAKEDLQIGFSLGDNLNSVKKDLILKNKGLFDSNISWSSSNETIINPLTGKVTRPVDVIDQNVTLTATINLPGTLEETTKTFIVKVISIINYNVSFDLDYIGGTAPLSQTVEKGQKASKPTEPTRAGFVFAGWTLDGEIFNFNTPINSDITLVAHWETEPDYVTVTFNSNGGSSVSPQTIVKGGQATEPANPTKSGYAFDGWYEDASFNYLFNFSSALYANTTLHAKWSEQTLMPYYSSVEGLSGSALQSGLRAIISSYRHRSYDAAKYVLPVSDQDPNNSSKVILVYNRASVNSTWDNGNTWNREHVWPQSLLAGASDSDLHNLKPCNNPINSSRGNSPFAPGSGSYGHVSGGWYPGDQDKGDIARIIFFMITRYSQLNVNTMGSLSMFKQWHIEDPVDDFERNRNEVLYQEQENRNPFIDHPEFVSLIWGSAQASYTVASDNEIITNVNYVEVLISYYKTQSKYVKREEPHLFYS